MGFIRSKHYGLDRVLEYFGAEFTVNPDAREIIEGELRCSYVFRNRCRISIKDRTHVRGGFLFSGSAMHAGYVSLADCLDMRSLATLRFCVFVL